MIMARDWDFLHEENLHDLEDQIGDAYEAADSVRQIARNAVDTANSSNLIAQNAQVIAQGARSDAQAAQSTARAAQTTAEAAQTAARDARTAAQTANEKAEAAQSTANMAQSTANIAKQKAGGAEQSAAEALYEAAAAQAAATSALAEAAQAIADAANALEVANAKQDPITAGNGIGIEDNEITNTKPNVWGVDPINDGVYFPDTIEPVSVNKNSVLISEATKLAVGNNRILSIFGGINVNLKTATPAGGTRFEITNNFSNRFTCACARNGYATIEQATAGDLIVNVTEVYLANDPDKTPLVPYSGATESRNNIVIETDAPLSETEAVKKMRLYGTMTYDTSLHCVMGGGTGGVTGKGKILQLGQSILSLDGNSIMVGNGMFNGATRSALFGFQHINHQIAALLAGQGHDSLNGQAGVAAMGSWSIITPKTSLAVGNGTSNTDRSNIFEVSDNNGETEIHVKSSNGTEYKITVDDTGTIQINAV